MPLFVCHYTEHCNEGGRDPMKGGRDPRKGGRDPRLGGRKGGRKGGRGGRRIRNRLLKERRAD